MIDFDIENKILYFETEKNVYGMHLIFHFFHFEKEDFKFK